MLVSDSVGDGDGGVDDSLTDGSTTGKTDTLAGRWSPGTPSTLTKLVGFFFGGKVMCGLCGAAFGGAT